MTPEEREELIPALDLLEEHGFDSTAAIVRAVASLTIDRNAESDARMLEVFGVMVDGERNRCLVPFETLASLIAIHRATAEGNTVHFDKCEIAGAPLQISDGDVVENSTFHADSVMAVDLGAVVTLAGSVAFPGVSSVGTVEEVAEEVASHIRNLGGWEPANDAMTAAEFERAYAERSGVSVEWLHERGRYVAPCDCGEDVCEGWQMTRTEFAHPADLAAAESGKDS